MREIKFRAWDKEDKKMFPVEILELPILMNMGTIMQFTGLKDKNGKEIYEGDLVKDDLTIFEVVFDFAEWRFVRTKGCYSYPCFYSQANRMEIIGNIYENGDLLKVK